MIKLSKMSTEKRLIHKQKNKYKNVNRVEYKVEGKKDDK